MFLSNILNGREKNQNVKKTYLEMNSKKEKKNIGNVCVAKGRIKEQKQKN